MDNKKALVFGETKGLDKSFDHRNFKPSDDFSQELQPLFDFSDAPANSLERLIICYECRHHAELDGYRFRLVPICRPCRTVREIEITNNRFERRNRK